MSTEGHGEDRRAVLMGVSKAVLPFPAMKDLPIFAGLTLAEFELITSAAQSKHFSEGEIIFEEGSPIREAAMLVSGSVKMTKMITMGSNAYEVRLEATALRALVEFFRAGASLREVAMLLPGMVKVTKIRSKGREITLETIASGAFVDSIPTSFSHRWTTHSGTAQAAEACRTLVWDLAKFEELRERIPTFRTNVFEALKQHLQEMQRRFQLRKQRMKPTSESKQRMKLMRREADKVMALYGTLVLIALGSWLGICEILKYAYK